MSNHNLFIAPDKSGYPCFSHFLTKLCCGYSLGAPGRGASKEYPQHMILWRNKKNIGIFRLKKSVLPGLCYFKDHTGGQAGENNFHRKINHFSFSAEKEAIDLNAFQLKKNKALMLFSYFCTKTHCDLEAPHWGASNESSHVIVQKWNYLFTYHSYPELVWVLVPKIYVKVKTSGPNFSFNLAKHLHELYFKRFSSTKKCHIFLFLHEVLLMCTHNRSFGGKIENNLYGPYRANNWIGF